MKQSSPQHMLKYGIGATHMLDSLWFQEKIESVSVKSDHGRACSLGELTDEEKEQCAVVDPSWEELPVIMTTLRRLSTHIFLFDIDKDTEITIRGTGAATIFVRVREGVSVKIRERILSQAVQIRIIVSLKSHAAVQYITLPRAAGSTTMALRQAFIGNDSSVTFCGAETAGADLVSQYISYLRGAGAQSHQYIVFTARDKQIRDIYTAVHHEAARTCSSIATRGVQRDQSVSFYRGQVVMAPAVSGASGHQQARMLLLSPGARAHAVPDLRVAHNNVSCSHAVGISHIDDTKTFYLESRGVSALIAREMLIRAHLQEIMDHFPADLQQCVMTSLV